MSPKGKNQAHKSTVRQQGSLLIPPRREMLKWHPWGGRLLKAVPIPETSKKTPHTISRMLNAISRVYALIIPTIHKL